MNDDKPLLLLCLLLESSLATLCQQISAGQGHRERCWCKTSSGSHGFEEDAYLDTYIKHVTFIAVFRLQGPIAAIFG